MRCAVMQWNFNLLLLLTLTYVSFECALRLLLLCCHHRWPASILTKDPLEYRCGGWNWHVCKKKASLCAVSLELNKYLFFFWKKKQYTHNNLLTVSALLQMTNTIMARTVGHWRDWFGNFLLPVSGADRGQKTTQIMSFWASTATHWCWGFTLLLFVWNNVSFQSLNPLGIKVGLGRVPAWAIFKLLGYI